MPGEFIDPHDAMANPQAAAITALYNMQPTRREMLWGLAVVGGLALAGCTENQTSPSPSSPNTSPSPESTSSSQIPTTPEGPSLTPEQWYVQRDMKIAGKTMLSSGEYSNGGLRFASRLQDGHYQTDRDVGAASVGMGFLALAEKYPEDKHNHWLRYAVETGKWLKSVRNEDGSWPDYVDDQDRSSAVRTSFDDGTIGIADYFWRLYEKTHDPEDKRMAIEGVKWTFQQAKKDGHGGLHWIWDKDDPSSPYYTGMGEGAFGLVHSFATFYERTKDTDTEFASECMKYMNGALINLEYVSYALGKHDRGPDVGHPGDERATPEVGDINADEGNTAMNSGYLSGNAGAAFAYLKLHKLFKAEKKYKLADKFLRKADEKFSWLEDPVNGPFVAIGKDKAAWKMMIDPEGGNNINFATGFEEGAAGIGWVFLQAYKVTRKKKYLNMANKAANWLLDPTVAKYETSKDIDNKTGRSIQLVSWHEDIAPKSDPNGELTDNPTVKTIHPNLNNGDAGIGMFLRDLSLVNHNKKHAAGAQNVLNYLRAKAVRVIDNNSGDEQIYWKDFEDKPFKKDPSWHWGNAGIIAYMMRMLYEDALDIPGEQPGL